MSTTPKSIITPEEYLRLERNSEVRSQYFRGEMFAMTGATPSSAGRYAMSGMSRSRAHNLICANVLASVHRQFDGRPCEVYQSDMRVKVSGSGLYTYPDVVATCESPQFEDQEVDTLLNPQAIVEVLSKSTEAYDRGDKFRHYRDIDSLQDYVLISQDKHRVERFSRQDDGQWLMWSTEDLNSVLAIPSIDCELTISDIYSRVDFDEPEPDAS